MKKIFLKPAKGLKVRDPDRGDFLPDDGREVVLTTFWRRRLRDGDVVEAKTQSSSSVAKSKSKEQ